jgi:hypothetical protein
MSPVTALNLESAKIVITISGEFVVKTATQSPLEIPFDSKSAAKRWISEIFHQLPNPIEIM